MKHKVFVSLLICGYLTIYCHGEVYTSSSTLRSVGTSVLDKGASSTDGMSSRNGANPKHIINLTTSSTGGNRLHDIRNFSDSMGSSDKISTTTTHPGEKDKQVIIKDVKRKICTLAKMSLKDAKKEDVPVILQKLEKKLTKALRGALRASLGNSYLQIIMKDMRTMVERNDYSACEKENKLKDIVNLPPDLSTSSKSPHTTHTTQQNNSPNQEQQRRDLMENDIVKQKLLRTMVEKLKKIANKSFKNTTTPEEKMQVLETLKKKLRKVMNRRNITTSFEREIPFYTDLILKGIKWMMNKDKNTSLMTFTSVDEQIERSKPSVKHFIQQYGNTKSTPFALMTSSGVTTEYDCSAIQKRICNSVHTLNEFVCSCDDTVISVEKICDDRKDCPDGSDENDCVKQAILRVHNATEIMKDVGLAKSCLFPIIESSMFNNQAKMMSEVLKNEISFINKYKQRFPLRDDKVKVRELDHRSLVDVTSDVFFLLRSFVIAMDGALCTDTLQSVDEMVKKLSEPLDRTLAEDVDLPLKDFNMKICDCNGPYCTNMTCPIGCRRICFQRNSLMLWSCRATDGSNGVTLDLICDGKFDCYDETDETGCVLYNTAAKFEANKVYDGVLKTIRTIMSNFGFEMARSQLGQLHDTIRTLQIKSMNPKTPNEDFKKFREKTFSLIIEIFDEALNSVAVELKSDSAFEYLESIKEKLIVALKMSFTGNKKIITPDGCFCRGLECALPVCSRKCIRTCMSKPKLTKYLCTSSNSTSIPLAQICNGNKNCPRGEDEDKCKTELCRRHHVVDLRGKLSKVGDKYGGTVLGEVLINWRTKAMANLRVLENQERPTATDIKLTMSEMLEHLVVSYASLADYKRFKSGLVLNKFEKLAQNMMETLKSCTR